MLNNYFTLKTLKGSKSKDPGQGIQKMAEQLKTSTETGTFQFQILKGDTASYFHIVAGKTGTKFQPKQAVKPDFELITSEETWSKISTGSLSPLKAFLQNQLRVRGNIESGQRFLLQFSGSPKTSK